MFFALFFSEFLGSVDCVYHEFWEISGYYVILAFLCPYDLMVPVIFLLGPFLFYKKNVFFFFPFCNAVDQTQDLIHARQELYSCFMLSSLDAVVFPSLLFFSVCVFSLYWLKYFCWHIIKFTNCFLHFVKLLDEAIEGILVMVFYF